MKKNRHFCIVIGGIILAVMIFYKNSNETIKQFDLTDYEREIKEFSIERELRPIYNSKIAKEEAEKIWSEIYGDEVKKLKPYIVSYDANNKAWLVRGSLLINEVGGIPYILINENGKVIAVWHDK